MIASHDTFTYDKPRNPVMNLLKIFWRCQKLDIKKQYELGVRIFDVRVSRYNGKWSAAHGIYKAKNIQFDTLSDICKYFKTEFPGSMIRIYLEDNTSNGKNKDILDLYLKEGTFVVIDYKDMIWEYGTHKPWDTYYKNDKLPFTDIKEYYCHLFNWDLDKSIWYNITHFDWSSWSLPLYAKKHNPKITKELINDTTMHIMDYVGIYPKD